ncbi:MAG TPA: ribbon-helix-helix domain-containing protein [Gammaproteobacteria bacterium]|nr:ribbon-helix-helix domain-containing protein [Gammaproteobacteria bacterium]
MKTIQITMDEDLLAELDRNEETRRDGRSAVLHRAASEYLKRRGRTELGQAYQRAYVGRDGLGPEFEGWEDEGGDRSNFSFKNDY